ncbi:thiol:disulfide interchange protein DsbA/DsbL [Streptomyces sp. NPDC059385]|uniref:thiol:disulfide interchange protein DsbA/DsbL n=1 Tax=Streptomyces sp. NPDC059385 TaxID=3346817 RepID=UPI0036B4F833
MANPIAGQQYIELSTPVPVSTPGKVEAVQLFWYGDPYSYHFEPTVNPWVEKLPADVAFRKVPAMVGGSWAAHGQMFLTLEAMGAGGQVHTALFDAVHNKRKRLADAQDQADSLAIQGVDKDKYLSIYSSFAMKGQVAQAKELAKKYEARGVPTMVVGGKYRFDLGTAGGPEGMLNVADHLIAKERAAK